MTLMTMYKVFSPMVSLQCVFKMISVLNIESFFTLFGVQGVQDGFEHFGRPKRSILGDQ